ncbi:type II secretion system minor pseudopilin GspH [Stutzerimonas azotifigens]|uniref:type II secretion system minor pseudopilin GspH n=1 Tax=Stutzerimonas azotifigens TaxID=291995 RepID=UPI0004832599|nr:type II secretion system minor pseudopilin GspH [Stutzerimonas azotifigens]
MPGRARACAGFTLIELMVVMVILGILISIAVLSIGTASTSRELRDEAQRLAATLGVLADEAVLDSREYGLWVNDQGYRVLRYDERQARWMSDRETPYRVPEWARLDLTLDGTPLRLAPPVESADEDAPGLAAPADDAENDETARRWRYPVGRGVTPQILVLSSGELSPFSLRISERQVPDSAWVVASDGFSLPSAEPAAERRR